MKNTIKKLILVIVFILMQMNFAFSMEVAITVDDLPKHMDLPPNTTRLDVAKKMLSSLKKHSLYNVYGFINAGNIKNDADRYDVLKLWVDSGQLLGNHTYDHLNFNTVNSQQFIRQLQMNESYLSRLMQNKDYRYFRYPYLYEGDSQEKRDTVREYLFANHYKVAQVTTDFEDYLWNNAYVRCVKKNENQSIEWLKKNYIDQALKSIKVAHAQSKLIFKRDIKQVLLLHIGVFDALMLDDLLTTFERHQIKLISLPEALQDKAYQINPNIVSKNTGGFLDQMVLANKIQTPNFVKNFIANIPQKKIDNLCRYFQANENSNGEIMKLIILFILSLCIYTNANAEVWQSSSGHKQIPIWPEGKMPDAIPVTKPEGMEINKNLIAGKPWVAIGDVTQPTITIYSPTTKNTGAAVIVFPGGGFHGLAIDLEGTEICEWLASQGITGILLKYRVPNSGPNWNEDCQCHVKPYAPAALEDAQRALGLVRFNAAKWHINPNKVGVIGFSAGGYMVADISTHFKKRAYLPIDAADNESSRPDFAIALYPGHMGMEDSKEFVLNPNIHFTKETPPTFLLQAEDDPVDTIDYSLLYYIGLKKAGVPVEMHLYANGGHAFGLRKTHFGITDWPKLVEKWLKSIDM